MNITTTPKKNDRLCVRFDPHDFLKITEISKKMKVSKGLLIRSIVTSFIVKNEDSLNNIIDK